MNYNDYNTFIKRKVEMNMRLVVQRVSEASVEIEGKINGQIKQGFMVLVGITNDDNEEIADFILGRDQAGNSYLGKALNDPDTLTRMAWFALRGADALDNIQEYFSKQITEVRKQAYAKGVEDARNGTPHVVIQPNNKQQQQQLITAFAENKYKSVDDLD